MTIDSGELIVETPAAPPPSAPIIETPVPPEPKAAEPIAKGPTVREGVEAAFKAVRERPRDEAGRFAAAEAEKAKAALAAVPLTPPAAIAVPAKIERPADMPKAWGADKTALWAAMTPEQRAYVTARETQMEGFHSKFGGLSQWHEAAAANNTTLPEVLDRVSRVETAMIQDPSQGFILAGEMVGMDRNATARALIGALQKLGVNMPAQGGVVNEPWVEPAQVLPPEVAALRQELDGIKSIFARQQEDRQRAELGKAQEQVKAFFADPTNKYANDVTNEISAELKAMKAMGIPLDLPKAYERAMWNRPDLRAKLIAEQVAPKQDAAAAAKAQELEKARSASRSVAGSPPLAEGRSSAERPSKLRDEIAMRVRNAAGRV